MSSRKSPISKTIKTKLTNKLTSAKERVLSRKLKTIRTKQAAKTIRKFMLNSTVREKSTALFLNSICSDSGLCIAFGQESLKIKKYFNNFTDFKYMTNLKKIGEASVSGFIYEIEYLRQKYKSYAVLKSNQNEESDNLMYEYFVGMAVNMFSKNLPCFIETYGLFNYNTDAGWNTLRNSKNITSVKKTVVTDNLTFVKNPTFDNLDKGCSNAKYQCILMQHLNNIYSLHKTFRTPNNINKLLISTLYIIYFSLASIGYKFTHYDLHTNNVMIYTPVKHKFIEYVFYDKQPGKIVKFKSEFIPKIIDYGHSYYSIDADNNSEEIYDTLCSLDECEPDCGSEQGFYWLHADQDYINSSTRNVSHDLRLMHILNKTVNIPNVDQKIKDLMAKVVYNKKFGTKELEHTGLPDKIHNVFDAFSALSDIMNEQEPALSDAVYADDKYSSLGELHVYSDGTPMKFIPFHI